MFSGRCSPWRRRPALAQESRGSISGTVKDNSGGALPGVTVTATKKDTNQATSAVTNEAGSFNLLFLQPGMYAVTAELSGFKKTLRDNVEVRVNDRMGLDLTMEIGGLEETVTVIAESPLLETRSASQGQIIDEKRISLLPLSDGNPFILARLAPGMAYTGDLKFSRPFDNAGTTNVVADGAPGVNEFTLDGSPNMASGDRVAFVPPSDAVQEFKVESATFDAQQGHTAGATINVAIKSGTNNFRGTGYFFYRNDALSTNEYFLEQAGKPKSKMDYTRWGGTLGGPIIKNKTFFFGVFERLDDAFPEPDVFSVPTAAQRNGDFSALLSQGITIYDPATAFYELRGPRRAPAVPGQRHSRQPDQPDRAELREVLPGAQPGRRRPGPEQLPVGSDTLRRLLLVHRPRRPPVQPEPAALRPLQQERPPRGPVRTGPARSMA